MKRLGMAVAAAVAMAVPAVTPAADQWLMASGFADDNFMTRNIRAFIDDVDESTDGALNIQLHSNGTLIELDSIRHAVRTGQVQIGEVRLGVYSNEDPMYTLSAIPFVAADFDDAWTLMEAQEPYFDELFGKLGLRVLAYQPWPGQGFFTKEPVESLADFEGQGLRIYSKATQQMGEMLGFDATILPFSEIPQAFATGLIDALFTSPQTGIDIQAWDNTGYFTEVGALYTKNAIVVNERAFQSLPQATRDALIAAGDRATKRGWELSQEAYKKNLTVLRDHGMTVEEAPREVVERMHEIGETLVADWRERASEEARDVLAEYRANR